MKPSIKLTGLAIFICVFLSSPELAVSQYYFGGADTVQWRSMAGALPDSTLVTYEMGDLAIVQTTGSGNLAFAPSTANHNFGYLTSTSFYSNGTSDTVAYWRSLSFDSANYFHIDNPASDAIADSLIELNSATSAPDPHPASTSFDNTSTVTFYVNVVHSSSLAVIATIDSLIVSRTLDGHLRYIAPADGPVRFTSALPAASNGDSVRLAVVMIPNLPTGSSLTETGTEFWALVPGPVDVYAFAQQMPVSPKQNSLVSQEAVAIRLSSLSAVHPNPARTSISVDAVVTGQGRLKSEIYNLAGTLIMSRSESVKPGNMQLTYDISSLRDGEYFLLLWDEVGSHITQFVVNN